MKKILVFQLMLIIIAGTSCKVNNSTSSATGVNSNTGSSSTVNVTNSAMTLFQYLKGVPGIVISGSESNPLIYVRQPTGLNSNNHPLFVINGQEAGKDYASVVSMVNVNDIKSITVLKDVASTSVYGMEGADGVILIRTKGGNDK